MRASRSSAGLRRCVALGLTAAVATIGCKDLLFVSAPATRTSDASLPHAGELAAAATTAGLLMPAEAWAKGGEWGVLEGKASSLVHPFVMASLFLATVYTGYLGLQWRRTRLISGDISALKKQLPKEVPEDAEMSPAAKAVKAQIDELQSERSDLVKEQYKDKHYQLSALLLGGGIFFTLYGTFNTFFRAQKLFPGPHLYAGAAVCALWALSASMVPYMEKGNETARTVHIALNVVNVILFVWQLFTGFEIFLKVIALDIPWF